MTDCHGRIGPFVDGEPDLRNASLTFAEVRDGDLVVVATDGVTDNFDPELLGVDAGGPKAAFMLRAINEHLTAYPTLVEVVESIFEFIVTTTASRRDQTAHTMHCVDADYKTFPGKLDHATLAVIRVEQRCPADYFFIDSIVPYYNCLLSAEPGDPHAPNQPFRPLRGNSVPTLGTPRP